MNTTRMLLQALALLVLSGPTLLADDITLKNGTVHRELTLVKETPRAYEYVTLDGRKLTLAKDSIAERTVKPTALDEFKPRRAALDMKDKTAMLELAAFAKEKGITREAQQLFELVIRLDAEDATAREALGYRKIDGKWLSAAEAAKIEAARLEASSKARGWRKVKDRWMRPVDAFRAEKDMVQVEGHWVLPAFKKKIDDGKLVYAEGDWLTAEAKAKFDQGLRPHLNKWLAIEALDGIHNKLADPWNLRSEHVHLVTAVRHERAKKILEVAEDIYSGIAAVMGEHPDLHDKRGRLVLVIGRGIPMYQQLGATLGASDREAHHSSNYGTFFSSKGAGPLGGASVGYDNDDDDWMRVWVGHGLAHAFFDRYKTDESYDERMIEAFAGYASGLHGGSWQPTWWQWARWFKDATLQDASRILDGATYRDDKSLAAAGLLLHFLQKKNPDAFSAFWETFAFGRGNAVDLLTACAGVNGKLDTKALDAEFQDFFQKQRAGFRPWDK